MTRRTNSVTQQRSSVQFGFVSIKLMNSNSWGFAEIMKFSAFFLCGIFLNTALFSGCKRGDRDFRREMDDKSVRAINELIINDTVDEESLDLSEIVELRTVQNVKTLFESRDYVGTARLKPQSSKGHDYYVREGKRGIDVFLEK